MDNKNYGFETLQIHAGQKPDVTTKATGMPLYLSNAFTFEDADQARIFAVRGRRILLFLDYLIQQLMLYNKEWRL